MARKTENKCPYCGGTAHRKALQKLADQPKAYRRMYCADGCGRYHYRDPETNKIVAVGEGPRMTKSERDAYEFIEALVEAAGGEKDREKLLDRVRGDGVETEMQFEVGLAIELGIDPTELTFTAKNDSGRPRALVNCLSDADIAKLSKRDQENVRQLHRQLLTTQALIGVYRERATKAKR